MATRGYSRYRGRNGSNGGKVIWIILLCLILLGAVAFLLAQQYLVYDDEGRVHWVFPAGHEGAEERAENPISPDDVTIEREEPAPEPPARPQLSELHARELENGSLWWQPAYVLSRVEEAMVIEIKTPTGGLRYGSSVPVAPGVVVEQGVTRDNLVELLQSDHYVVARVNCFCDNAYARGTPDTALLTADGQLWLDEDGHAWLDPAGAGTLSYLTALCQELAELGFDEILLDSFSYPTTGDTGAIDLAEGTDKTAILGDFAAAIRKALPNTVMLSVTVREDLGETAGASGVTAELLYGGFDRLYLDAAVDTAALTAQLPDTLDAATELAALTYSKPQSGSYVLLP